MEGNLLTLLVTITMFTTTQAFSYGCKTAYAQSLIPEQDVDDKQTSYFKFATPGYPGRWYDGGHCFWRSDTSSPSAYSATCNIDIPTSKVCNDDVSDRVEIHYLSRRGRPAKYVFCGPTSFQLNKIELIDVFVSPGNGGYVKCDIIKSNE